MTAPTAEITKRISELSRAEKEAWANLNYIVGCREELERLLSILTESHEDNKTDDEEQAQETSDS